MTGHEFTDQGTLRSVAYGRQHGACAACGDGMHLERAHLHHRKRRRDLGHCACNTILLHADCHNIAPGSVHQRPAWARARGLIVPSWEDTRTVPVRTVDGTVWLTCGGTATFTPPEGQPHHTRENQP